MPRKPRHPCDYPGCPALVEHGARYCPEHQQIVKKDYERYGRDPQTKKRHQETDCTGPDPETEQSWGCGKSGKFFPSIIEGCK